MRQFKIFVDMDNVICAFDQAVHELGDVAAEGLGDKATEPAKLTMYSMIEAAGPEFWSSMSWHPEGRIFWRFAKQFNPVLLSNPGEFSWAVAGKTNWIDRNLPGVTAFFEPNKYIYAERGAILVDDMQKNVGAWETMGGIGILFKDAASATNDLLDAIRGYSPSRSIHLSQVLRHIAKKILHEDPVENKRLLEVFQEDE
jgi:hypothetical protein